MAVNIEIQEPYEAPTISVELISGGGTLSAGNYKFAIFYNDGQRKGAPLRTSPFSNIVETTVVYGDTVRINYTLPESDSNTYFIIVSSKDGGEWEAFYQHLKDSSYNGVFNVTSDRFGSYWSLPKNYEYHNENFFNLNMNKGIGRINITGDGNFTLKDINDALELSTGATNGVDFINMGSAALITTYSLSCGSYGGGTLDIKGSLLYVYGGISLNADSLIIDANPSSANRSTTKICVPQRGGYFSGFLLGNINGSFLSIDTGLANSTIRNGAGLNLYKDSDISYSLVLGQYMKIDPAFSNSILYPGSGGHVYEDIIRELNIVVSYLYPKAANPCTMYDCNIYCRNTSYQIFWLPNAYNEDDIPKFYDTKFIDFETGSVYAYEDMGFRDHNLYGRISYLYFYNSINFIIKNNEGDVLTGATITVVNGQDEIFEFTSDENGEIDEYLLMYYHTNDGEEETTHTSTNAMDKNFNPFKITISKDGYYDEIMEKNIKEKLSQDIILKDVEPIIYYQQELQGTIETKEISGSVETQEISGVIQTQEITGTIEIEE